jgi:hypothetical protein
MTDVKQRVRDQYENLLRDVLAEIQRLQTVLRELADTKIAVLEKQLLATVRHN